MLGMPVPALTRGADALPDWPRGSVGSISHSADLAMAACARDDGLAAIGVWSIELLAITGVAVVLLTRCIDPEEAWRSIDGNVIVLIFGMLAFGVGLQQAGTVDLIVNAAMPYIALL